MKKIMLILANGFKYSGEILSENEEYIILRDAREGEIKVFKKNIALLKEVQ